MTYSDGHEAMGLEKLLRGDVAGAENELRQLAMFDLINLAANAQMLAMLATDMRAARWAEANAAGTTPT